MNTEHEPLKGNIIVHPSLTIANLWCELVVAGFGGFLFLATHFITFMSTLGFNIESMFSWYYQNQTLIGSWSNSNLKDISKGHNGTVSATPLVNNNTKFTILIQGSAWEDLSYEPRWSGLKSLGGSTFPEEILNSKFQPPFFRYYVSSTKVNHKRNSQSIPTPQANRQLPTSRENLVSHGQPPMWMA